MCSSSCNTSFRRFPANHSDGGRQIRPIHLLDCLIHNLYKAIVNLQRLTEELNFTRAAERLHMVYARLGYEIRQLEEARRRGTATNLPRGGLASMTPRTSRVGHPGAGS